MVNQANSGNERVDLAYRRKKNAEDMKHQVISFVLMILFTLIAFTAVGYDKFSPWFSVPFILLLAVVQVLFQLYYFMHMSHKGHEMPALFMYGGILVAFVTIWAFATIIWW
ncbi:cytochrome c oxidase subunit IVB [Geobacillus sp. NFOSA3]|jgi:cytochrome c oxidase subunit IV|uniref:Cytochrome c oxidase, subunit IV n=1 Tax=Geobacillus sp. (strain WCH70) TaxID=471223 RepID=C5D8J0_GEOSW|nr:MULTISPECIES: cytochrome c oxidase subunit IVB [Bacillaceae]NNU92081.1 cytochrome c oxidase subunit IVB [Geobacillus sp. NFOSA3]OQO99324.1 cytochrome c oxidase subunit IVB [Geobacillus sp. 44C]PDM40221.1 cytochrome c oxidase subunit IVB [Parageobacillus yumthangensis]TXK91136.1 cytochrome c oxidase subunit IVB [Parageobacillus sp. SY1]MED4988962.1 cytochrome c oxidase subunit IVB [Parageobacillus toebii]